MTGAQYEVGLTHRVAVGNDKAECAACDFTATVDVVQAADWHVRQHSKRISA